MPPKWKYSGVLQTVSNISSQVIHFLSAEVLSSLQSLFAIWGYFWTATHPWRLTCCGLYPVILQLWDRYGASIIPSVSEFYSLVLFRLAVLVFRCRNSTAPEYLARDLQWAVDDDSRKRLRSASSHKLVVRRSRLKTVGDRVFGVAAPRVWNDFPSDVTSAQSSSTFKKHLKTSFRTFIYLIVYVLLYMYFVTCPWSFGLRQAKFVIIIIITIIIMSSPHNALMAVSACPSVCLSCAWP